jgi:hypothetical protein
MAPDRIGKDRSSHPELNKHSARTAGELVETEEKPATQRARPAKERRSTYLRMDF